MTTALLIAVTLAAAASSQQSSDGLLIGCTFVDEGATEQKPSFSGIGVYFPTGKAEGAIEASMIRDSNRLLRGAGFKRAESSASTVRFTGATTMTLRPTGGGMFDATLTGTQHRTGICQVGRFADRDTAFAFFDGLMRGLNNPSERG